MDFSLKRNRIEQLKSNEQRARICTMINEYNALVHNRAKFSTIFDANATTAVEGVLSRFSDDAVNTTFSMVWSSSSAPFRIIDLNDKDRDLSDVTEKLIHFLSAKNTDFKRALRHALRCFLEYGSAWIYVLIDTHGNLRHRVFSLLEIHRKLDMYNQPVEILLERGDDEFSFFEQNEKGFWEVNHHDKGSMGLRGSKNLLINPLVELTQTGIYSDSYPIGYGLKALADLKRYDNIVKKLTEVAGDELNPIFYTTSGINNANKSLILANRSDGTRENPIIIDDVMGARMPFGSIQNNANSVDAWRIFEIVSVSLRESFNFINRLMTIKDDAQMTATEAQIRTSSDLEQVRDTLDAVFDWLQKVNKAQLYTLFLRGDMPELKGVDISKLAFEYASVFKKKDEQNKLSSISVGLDLIAKITQVAQILRQSGGSELDQQAILAEVAKITQLALASEAQQSGLSDLLGLINRGQ